MINVKLGDVLDVKRGASLAGDYYATEGNLVRLTLGNFNYPGGGFKENTSKADIYFTGPIKPEFILNKGDIITPLTEQVSGLLGETATIPEGGKYIQSGDVGLIVPDETKLDKRFAYYLISSPIVKKQLDAAAQQTKIRHTSPDAIKACEAWIPEDISTQHVIGALLDAINAKIDNNREACEQLESLSRLIYDYWFVQFDFPDENGKPYKSSGGKMVWNEELKREIPEGWEVRPIEEYISVVRGISYKPSDELKNCGPHTVTLLKSNNIQNGSVSFDQPVYLPETHASNDQWLNKGSVFITMSSGSKAHMGKTAIIYKDLPYVFGAFCAKIVIDNSVNCYLSTYFRSNWFRTYIENVTLGTSINNIGNEQLTSIVLPFAPESLQKKFEKILQPLFDNIGELRDENQQLASLRDFLLPMLMNGQVKVGKAGE